MKTAGGSEGRDLRDRLHDLKVDAPDDGFSASLHRRLVAAGSPEVPGIWRRLWPSLKAEPRVLWPAFGVAAGLAVVLVLRPLHDGPRAHPRGREPRVPPPQH